MSLIQPTPDLRQIQILEWLNNMPTLLPATLRAASADASFRRYFRVDTTNGPSLIIMDAPPPQENVQPFIEIAHLFSQIGLSVPAILAQDVERGFLLLSDLGSTTYLQQLNNHNASALYQDAIHALLQLQTQSDPRTLPRYDRTFLLQEMQLFSDWYLSKYPPLHATQTVQLEQIFTLIADNNMAQPAVFVHRDFHSRNLMILPKGNPGILDFQGARFGPITYDLVSLLRDVYIQWQEEQVLDWVIRYWEQAKSAGLPVRPEFDNFYRDFEYMGLQRHLKILGIFARLSERDGKHGYLKDIPLVREYVYKTALRYRELTPLAKLLDQLENKMVQTGYTF